MRAHQTNPHCEGHLRHKKISNNNQCFVTYFCDFLHEVLSTVMSLFIETNSMSFEASSLVPICEANNDKVFGLMKS